MSDYNLDFINVDRVNKGLTALTPDYAERIARIKPNGQDTTQFLTNYVIGYRPGIAKRNGQ